MIARSDRVVPLIDEGLGDEVHFFAPAALRFDSPNDGEHEGPPRGGPFICFRHSGYAEM
jgi:hypothetical protein